MPLAVEVTDAELPFGLGICMCSLDRMRGTIPRKLGTQFSAAVTWKVCLQFEAPKGDWVRPPRSHTKAQWENQTATVCVLPLWESSAPTVGCGKRRGGLELACQGLAFAGTVPCRT